MLNSRRVIRSLAAGALTVCAVTAGAGAAAADDHLFDAAHSSGVAQRGFVNPVANNPSGTSGAAAQPGTVPGLGNPSSGSDLGTPSFDCMSLTERLAARSRGVGPSCG